MNTAQLSYFLTLAQTLSYTTAAERLYITQPTLSRNIMALEAELDTRLFARRGNSIALTEAGKAFYQELLPLSVRYERLVGHVKNLGRGLSGELVIAVSGELQLPARLLRAVRAFRERFPEISVAFQKNSTEEIRRGLLDETVDLGIQLGYLTQLSYPLRNILLSEEAPCYASAFSSETGPLSAQDCIALLERHTLCFPSYRANYTPTLTPLSALREMFHAPDASPAITFVRDADAVALYVAAGMGVTVCNQSHVLALQPGVTLREVTGAERYRLELQYNASAANPALQRFLDFYAAFSET